MRNAIQFILSVLISCTIQVGAQVPASQEPFHRVVFQNKYIRVLDVLLQPNDTSQFHIHSLPSLFVYFSNTNISLQTKGKDWVKQQSVSGNARYTSYSPDILIHRVTNSDSLPFHVNDVEILSSYDTTNLVQHKPLKFPLLFENERSFAYRLTKKDIKMEITKARGPLIAELVSGNNVFFNYAQKNESQEIKAGHFFYIEPNTSFYFTAKGTSEINMILFEIR